MYATVRLCEIAFEFLTAAARMKVVVYGPFVEIGEGQQILVTSIRGGV
jgi:hypothetical protein